MDEVVDVGDNFFGDSGGVVIDFGRCIFLFGFFFGNSGWSFFFVVIVFVMFFFIVVILGVSVDFWCVNLWVLWYVNYGWVRKGVIVGVDDSVFGVFIVFFGGGFEVDWLEVVVGELENG